MTWTFDPVEPVSAEQDEVDEDRQCEQEYREGNQNATGIKKKPNAIHDMSPLTQIGLCQHGNVLHGPLQLDVTASWWEP
jgi:hypothetical protein